MKVSGILVFCFGVGLILYPLFISYNIFTGNVQPPDMFGAFASKPSLEGVQGSSQENFSNGDIIKLVEDSVKNQLQSALPAGVILHFLNIAAWSILSWIFIIGGSHLASLGIKLMR